MESKLSQQISNSGEKTPVFIVDINYDLSDLVGAQSEYEEFKTDIKTKQTFWFYHAESKRRCILGVASECTPKILRGLAKKVCTELHSL
jgi:hypothetical protein